jgi:hypothetical protein
MGVKHEVDNDEEILQEERAIKWKEISEDYGRNLEVLEKETAIRNKVKQDEMIKKAKEFGGIGNSKIWMQRDSFPIVMDETLVEYKVICNRDMGIFNCGRNM